MLTISIVTPSYNSGMWIESTMQSILNQNYPQLEYVVMDGASTDNTLEILNRYSDQFHYWQSAPDDGHYASVNDGFNHTSGDIMAWLNADDLYFPHTFAIVNEIFEQFPEVEWLTAGYPVNIDRRGYPTNTEFQIGYSKQNHMRGAYIPGYGNYTGLWNVMQESTFWRRSLWEKVGGQINTDYILAGDFDLWTRFFQHTELYTVQTMLAGFRTHGEEQRSIAQGDRYFTDCIASLRENGGRPSSRLEQTLYYSLGRRVPRPLNGWLRLAYPCKIIKMDKNQTHWQIMNKYA